MALAGMTKSLTVTITPDFIDSDGYPAAVCDTFDVHFVVCPSITSLSFSTALPATYQHMILVDSPAVIPFTVQ